MPTDYLVQALLFHDSGLPEDVTVNTFSINTNATDDLVALEDAITAIHTFYLAIDAYFSSSLNELVQFRAYKRQDPEPRAPKLIIDDTIAVGATRLPSEVALCVSFQGVQVSGEPQARRRGRIYLGPLAHTVNNTNDGRPIASVVTDIAAAADVLLDASVSSSDWSWQVWSQVNGVGVNVVDGWIDNAFDTQRRRGLRATSRTTFDG